jgi:two-component system, chemotaxis family, protein-glutamate methylesterase/glutaminase
VVQHMPPIFTKHLANRLNQQTPLNVVEARHGDILRPGSVLIAPGDFHLTLKRQGNLVKVELDQGPPQNSCRPAVDVLFRSAVEIYGRNLLSIVLTGMGQDGARACELIRDAGGQVMIQDQPTSVVWGMPGAVSRAGLADIELPLTRIAEEVRRLVNPRCTSPVVEAITCQ